MLPWSDRSTAITTTAPRPSLTGFCEKYERETRHAVTVQLRVENADAEHAKCSREPYSTSGCLDRPADSARRKNGA